MGIVRDIGFTLEALQETVLVTSAALFTTAGSTGAFWSFNSTAAGGIGSPIISTGEPFVIGGTSTANNIAFGRIIDRLAAPLGAGYYGASVNAYARATRGSTEAERRFQIGVKLQHGDSSGGGDQVDYSTANTPAIRSYFSSARTTDQLSWEVAGRSTGTLDAVSNPCYYSLDAAKRFLRVVVFAGKARVTTESSADEQARVGGSITFVGADVIPQQYPSNLERNSPESSSTSTF